MKNTIDKEKYPNAYGMFNFIIKELNPRIPKTDVQIAEYLRNYHEIKINFMGGNGDKRMTLHENIFHYLFGFLEQQVSFGTGVDGLKIWGSKRFVADFYNPHDSTIFEIDGDSHLNYIRRYKDYRRKMFFESIGIEVLRITNQRVIELLTNRLVNNEIEGFYKIESDEPDSIGQIAN